MSAQAPGVVAAEAEIHSHAVAAEFALARA